MYSHYGTTKNIIIVKFTDDLMHTEYLAKNEIGSEKLFPTLVNSFKPKDLYGNFKLDLPLIVTGVIVLEKLPQVLKNSKGNIICAILNRLLLLNKGLISNFAYHQRYLKYKSHSVLP